MILQSVTEDVTLGSYVNIFVKRNRRKMVLVLGSSTLLSKGVVTEYSREE